MCPRCDVEIGSTLETGERVLDVETYDAAYERELETPCGACGKTPREWGEFAALIGDILQGKRDN